MRGLPYLALLCFSSLIHGSPAELIQSNFSYGGLEREVLSQVPPGKGPFPLVMALHGGGGKAAQMPRLSGLSELARREGFIVLYPDSGVREWNDGRDERPKRASAGHDDSGWLNALARDWAGRGLADAKRIYVCGISNGGFMTERLACEHPETFAAAGLVAATATSYPCPASAPLPICFIHGTRDPIVPYAGGDIRITRFSRSRGKAKPLDDALAFWVARNHSGSKIESEVPDADPGDGTRIRRWDWPATPGGCETLAYVVEGGGHTWPGGFKYAPEWLVGNVSRDADAGLLLWDFFRRQAKK